MVYFYNFLICFSNILSKIFACSFIVSLTVYTFFLKKNFPPHVQQFMNIWHNLFLDCMFLPLKTYMSCSFLIEIFKVPFHFFVVMEIFVWFIIETDMLNNSFLEFYYFHLNFNYIITVFSVARRVRYISP